MLGRQIIRDPRDPAVACFRGSDVRSAVAPGNFVVETMHVVRRLLESDLEVFRLLVSETRLPELEPLLAATGRASLEILIAPSTLLTEIVGFDRHRGIAASAKRPAAVDPLAVIAGLAGHKTTTLLIAEGIVDPINIGAIIRASRAFAVDLLILGPGCGDPWSRRASRAAMGNNLAMHRAIARVEDLSATLKALKNASTDLQIAAATTGAKARSLTTWSRGKRLALLLGNEGVGLSEALQRLADTELTIPMASGVDSLNVGAATAVLLYAVGGLISLDT